MKVELFDRHAEHVDPNVPLCEHTDHNVRWGEIFTITVDMSMPGWLITSQLVKAEAQVEIHFLSKNHVKVIINQPDYLAAKKALEVTKEFDRYTQKVEK